MTQVLKGPRCRRRASVSPAARQARGGQRGWGAGGRAAGGIGVGVQRETPPSPQGEGVSPPPRLPGRSHRPPRPSPQCPGCGLPGPGPAPPAPGGQRAAVTHRLPGPRGGFGLGRTRAGPHWKPRPHERSSGQLAPAAARHDPAHEGQSANHQEPLEAGSNQKLLRLPAVGKGGRRRRRPGGWQRGRALGPRPDGQRGRPIARRGGRPGAGGPRAPG